MSDPHSWQQYRRNVRWWTAGDGLCVLVVAAISVYNLVTGWPVLGAGGLLVAFFMACGTVGRYQSYMASVEQQRERSEQTSQGEE
jgi:hypothetical protein